MSKEWDFKKGVDLTAIDEPTGSQLNNLIENGEPRSQIGFIVVNESTPDTAANPRYQRYIWYDSTNNIYKRYTESGWLPINDEYITTLINTIFNNNINDYLESLDIGAGNLPLFVYENIDALRLQDTTVIGGNFVAMVLGHTTVNDKGGGFFIYQPTNTDADDNGATIEPNDTVGAFVRLKPDKPRPEMFGPANNHVTIQACLDAYNHVVLSAGTDYTISAVAELTINDNAIIEGEAQSARLLLGASVDADPDSLFSIIRQSGSQSNNVTIRNLSIDCGWTNQGSGASTIQAVAVAGYNNVVHDVKITNYACGTAAVAGSLIQLRIPSASGSETGGRVERCHFGGIGDVTVADGKLTFIDVGGNGAWGGSSWTGSYGRNCIIRDNFATGNTRDGTKQSKVRFINLEFVDGALISGNYVTGFGGAVVEQTKWPAKSVVFTNNKLINVLGGLKLTSSDANRTNFEKWTITDNQIFLLGGSTNNEFLATGIHLSSLNLSDLYVDVLILNNQFQGSTYNDGADKYPIGIHVENDTSTTAFKRCYIDGNFFNFPDAANPGTTIEFAPHANGVVFDDEDGYVGIVFGLGNRNVTNNTQWINMIDTLGTGHSRIYPRAARTQGPKLRGAFASGVSSPYDLYTELDLCDYYRIEIGSGDITITMPPDNLMNEGDIIEINLDTSTTGTATINDNDGNLIGTRSTTAIAQTIRLMYDTSGTNNWRIVNNA